MMRPAIAARWLAIAIALLGVIDPAFTSLRDVEPDIAIVVPNPGDAELARRIGERLDDDYTVVSGPWDRAAATIIVGTELPEAIPRGPLFAVRDPEEVRIVEFDVPPIVNANARIRIPLLWRPDDGGSSGELRANGVIVGRDTASGADGGATFELTPAAPGPTLLQGRVVGGRRPVTVDALVNVVDRPSAVLFFDRRPSWMSTFVRRALEQDRRFAVASRVITSRGVSTDAGQPPSTLADPAVLELYDVIVVGAPAALTAGDVAGLEGFLRRRGGSVVLLYDELPTAGAHARLTGAMRWVPATLRTAVTARASGDSAAERITEVAWPAGTPATFRAHAVVRVNDVERPVLWSVGFGRGQVLVSGALDAWKFRDRGTSGFDEFWRATISRAAREAGDAMTVELTPNVAMPGERIRIRVAARETTAVVSEARVDSATVRLWRGGRAGEFVGDVRAPAVGEHWVRVEAGRGRAEAPLVVRDSVLRVSGANWPTLTMLARASGGVAGTVNEVESALRGSVVAERRPERWWVMRSGWWVLPFVGLLGFEWWVRRRRGLA